MRIGVAAVIVSLVVPALASCGTESENPTAATTGDCNGSIRFQGVVYVVDTRLNQAAPMGRTIGPGAVVDCDHRTVVDRVVVSGGAGSPRRIRRASLLDQHGSQRGCRHPSRHAVASGPSATLTDGLTHPLTTDPLGGMIVRFEHGRAGFVVVEEVRRWSPGFLSSVASPVPRTRCRPRSVGTRLPGSAPTPPRTHTRS